MEKKQSQYRDLNLLPRRWFPLPRLDYYILREFLIKYSVLLLVFVILFILSDVYRDISDFLEAKASWQSVLLYLGYKLPGNVRFILPISMLLGCMWTMATFGKNMEITAMRASGVSLFRCGGAIIAVGLVVTGINIYFNEILIPQSERQAAKVLEVAVKKRVHVQNLLAYRSQDLKRQWLFQSFNSGSSQDNVAVKTFWTEGMIRQFVTDCPAPLLSDLVRRMFRVKGEKLLSYPLHVMLEKIQKELLGRKVDINATNVSFDEEAGVWHFKKGTLISYDRNDETIFKASMGTSAMHELLPFAELTFDETEMPEKPNDILNAIKEKDDLPTWVIWDLLRRSPKMAARVRSIYETVFYYRLAFPWACFIAVFLGIPLATKNERTGSLMAIITAVALIVVYIVVAQVFLVLGKGGMLNPVFAGLAPTFLFIFCGMAKILFDRN